MTAPPPPPIRCYHCGQWTTFGVEGHAPDCPVPELIALATGETRAPTTQGSGATAAALYEQMGDLWFRDMRAAFVLDLARADEDATRLFCTGRIALIDRVLAERKEERGDG